MADDISAVISGNEATSSADDSQANSLWEPVNDNPNDADSSHSLQSDDTKSDTRDTETDTDTDDEHLTIHADPEAEEEAVAAIEGAELSFPEIIGLVTMARDGLLPSALNWEALANRRLVWLHGTLDVDAERQRAEQFELRQLIRDDDEHRELLEQLLNERDDEFEPEDDEEFEPEGELEEDDEHQFGDAFDPEELRDDAPQPMVTMMTAEDPDSAFDLNDEIVSEVTHDGSNRAITTIQPAQPLYHTTVNRPLAISAAASGYNRRQGRPYLITANHVARGCDPQNLPWHRFGTTRSEMRAQRDAEFALIHNHQSPSQSQRDLSVQCESVVQLYDFYACSQALSPGALHFQLRHLIHAVNSHTVIGLSDRGNVSCYNALNNTSTVIWDMTGNHVQHIMSIGVDREHSLILAGGGGGELWIIDGRTGRLVRPMTRITESQQAICNGITFYDSITSGRRCLISNNDSFVRSMDMQTLETIIDYRKHCPINYAVASPDGRLIVMTGDDQPCWLVDANSGQVVSELIGHETHSFSAAWHPSGLEFATASQDCTARVWDMRNLSSSRSMLCSRFTPVRSIKYSGDGSLLYYAEQADILHIRKTDDLSVGQIVDGFGEINGFDISPSDSSSLFIGLCEPMYGGLWECHRNTKHQWESDPF